MAQDNYALLTRTGRLKEAQRMAGQSVPAITHMAFGDADRSPTGGEAALGHEVHRAALTGWGIEPGQTAAFFDCYVPAAIGGFVVREIGLYDALGDLIAIGRRSPGLPKVAPENGGGDDLTFRIDVFFDDLDTLVVEVSPIAGLTADNLDLYLHPNNLPVEAAPIAAAPANLIDRGQWIVGPNPTGIFAGKAHQIARWRGGVWRYETPRAGRMASFYAEKAINLVFFDGAVWQASAIKRRLDGMLALYVRADGSDANDGLANTAAGAFRTINGALDALRRRYDPVGYPVRINVGAGGFEPVTAFALPGYTIEIVGAGRTATVIGTGQQAAVYAKGKVEITLRSLRFDAQQDHIIATDGARVSYADVQFNTCTGRGVWSAGGSFVEQIGLADILGNMASFFYASTMGVISCVGQAIVNPSAGANYSAAFAETATGLILLRSNTFNGVATGKRFNAVLNGVIDTNTGAAANTLPGNAAGTVATGGQYQ